MAHNQIFTFVNSLKLKQPKYFENKRVFEVGSAILNGSIRTFFNNCDYIGCDVGESEGVDVIISGHEYSEPNESFDVCCSVECFEHNPFWLETFTNMIRLCKSQGLVFFTCTGYGREEHGTKRTSYLTSKASIDYGWDFYRNLSPAEFKQFIDFDDVFLEYQFIENRECGDLYFCGIKK